MVVVRDYRETDGDSVRSMMKTLAGQRKESDHNLVLKDEYARFFGSYMMSFLKNPDAVVKIAEDDNEVVGYAVATRGREAAFFKYSHVAILSDVFVRDSHRGKGVGRILLEAIEKWARAQRLQAIEVNVFPDHAEEIGSLKGLGFFPSRVKMLRPLDAPPGGGPRK
ncbi:MAG TPA: GNAT family N-acetyltransferase [Candidatus Thermoplasmatota archaeon]|nr:GNAT family N-acetyltransferase [Candidatus Thermoplasmatota archaeon]